MVVDPVNQYQKLYLQVPTVPTGTYRTVHMNQFQLNNESGW